MNVNALSNIANPYIQSLTNAAMSALNSSQSPTGTSGISGSAALPQDSSPQLSPFAQLMSTLQQLQQNSPTQYAQVTQQIAANLQSASQTALANGNTVQAQQLSTLSNDFTSASTNDQLPNISDLAQAMGGGHHHHHGSGAHSSSSSIASGTSTNSTGSGTAAGSTGSSSSTGSTSTASETLSQLFGAYTNNDSEGEALNPLNIILGTLANDGISLGN
ncbi:MAG TPA: hypothetical protein VME43_15780 [Bryobacteraceae bacterium]|nr:hypothetical protein [Bryobacteraceae bacterium]